MKELEKQTLMKEINFYKGNLNDKMIEYINQLLNLKISGLNPKNGYNEIIHELLELYPLQIKKIILYNLYNKYIRYFEKLKKNYDLIIENKKNNSQNFRVLGYDKNGNNFNVFSLDSDENLFVEICVYLTSPEYSEDPNLQVLLDEYKRIVVLNNVSCVYTDSCDFDYFRKIQLPVSQYVLKDLGLNLDQYMEKEIKVETEYVKVYKFVTSSNINAI